MANSNIRNRGSSMGSDNTLISEGAHEPIDNNPAHLEPEKPAGLVKRLMKKSPAVKFCVCVGAAFGVGMYAGMALSGGPGVADGSAGGLRMNAHNWWDEVKNEKAFEKASFTFNEEALGGLAKRCEEDKAYLTKLINSREGGPAVIQLAHDYGDRCRVIGDAHYRDSYVLYEKAVELWGNQGAGEDPKEAPESTIEVKISKRSGYRMQKDELAAAEKKVEDFPIVDKIDTRNRPGRGALGRYASAYDQEKAQAIEEAEKSNKYFDASADAESLNKDFLAEAEKYVEPSKTYEVNEDEKAVEEKDFEKAMYKEDYEKSAEDKKDPTPANTTSVEVNCAKDKVQMKIDTTLETLTDAPAGSDRPQEAVEA